MLGRLDLPFSTEDLVRLYRFALLLTGDERTAQQVLFEACVDCAARLGSVRSHESRMACMLGAVRQKAKSVPAGGARGIAKAFARLPEEERVALAGLYTGLLPARELSEALKMTLWQLGRSLKNARERLHLSDLELENLEQAL